MGRGKLPLRLIEKERARRITCAKRKKGLAKKAYELSTLCDIRVCLVIHDPDSADGNCLKTFPENLGEVRQIIDDYFTAKAKNPSNSKRDKTLADFYSERITKLRNVAEIVSSRGGGSDPVWDPKIDEFSHEELSELLARLDRKIDEVSRIKKAGDTKKAMVVAENNSDAELLHHLHYHHQGSSSSNGGSSALAMFDHDHDHQWTAGMNNLQYYTRLLEAPDLCALEAGFESSSAAAALANNTNNYIMNNNYQINHNNNYISDGINGNYYYHNVDHAAALYPMYQNAWSSSSSSATAGMQYYRPGQFYHGPAMFEYSGGSQEDLKVFGNPSHLGYFGKPGSEV